MPKLVLLPGLHGSGTLAEDFRTLTPAEQKLSIISYPDNGPYSYEKLVELFVPQLNLLQELILIGESFGGPLAILLAQRLQKVKAVILVGSFVSSPAPRWTQIIPTNWLTILPIQSVLPRIILAGFNRNRNLDTLLKQVLADVSVNAFINRVEAIRSVDVKSQLSKLNLPLLYLQAKSDYIVPSRCGKEVVRLAQNGVLLRIEGAHMLLETSPQACWAAILEFIKTQL